MSATGVVLQARISASMDADARLIVIINGTTLRKVLYDSQELRLRRMANSCLPVPCAAFRGRPSLEVRRIKQHLMPNQLLGLPELNFDRPPFCQRYAGATITPKPVRTVLLCRSQLEGSNEQRLGI